MNCHIDIIFITGRHDTLQEIFQICKKLLIVNILIQLKEFFHSRHTLRLPARHNETIGIRINGCKHLFRLQCIHCCLIVCQHGRTIRSFSCQFCSCPVKYRHEVITYHMNIFLSQAFQCCNIILYVLLSVGRTNLNCIMNIHTFNSCNREPCCLYFFLHGTDIFQRPCLSWNRIIQCRNHTLHPRNLTNLLQCNRIMLTAIPS